MEDNISILENLKNFLSDFCDESLFTINDCENNKDISVSFYTYSTMYDVKVLNQGSYIMLLGNKKVEKLGSMEYAVSTVLFEGSFDFLNWMKLKDIIIKNELIPKKIIT